MLTIRMQRVGRKHEPVYRLVLTDSRNSTKSGRFLEILGSYDARRSEQAEVKAERISHWMGHGAELSPTVHNLLVTKGIVKGKKVNVLPKSVIDKARAPKEVPAEPPKEEAPAETAEAAEAAPVDNAPIEMEAKQE